MSVLIKGMKMPEHCGYCRFRYDGICHALQKTQYSEKECPLVSVNDKLESVPSAEPEIIRCKDCKHYDGRPCGIVDWYNTADDFCSKAERRTDG